jgi:hypothetical protein
MPQARPANRSYFGNGDFIAPDLTERLARASRTVMEVASPLSLFRVRGRVLLFFFFFWLPTEFVMLPAVCDITIYGTSELLDIPKERKEKSSVDVLISGIIALPRSLLLACPLPSDLGATTIDPSAPQ